MLVHRPGLELRRITPRTKGRLGFDAQPWVARAQQEHDVLTDVLRDRGAEVLYVTELLQDVLAYASARDEAIAAVLAEAELGDLLGARVREHLETLPPEDLAAALIAGLTPGEIRSGRGLVYDLLDAHDFVIDPLPSLVFTRNASTWIGDQAIVASLPGPRRRESALMAVIYGHHPRFGGLRARFDAGRNQLDGGDVLLLTPGVVAVGVGARTSPASAERLAKHLFESGVAHTVLAVPMNQRGEGGHLDRVCTVIDSGVVIMVPALAFTLTALTITPHLDELRVSRPQPFLEAAARAIGVERLTVIDTGLDSNSSQASQWDDGGNALAIAARVAVCNERNVETNARLETAGFEVIAVPGSELGPVRGGPRGLCAPISRDPIPLHEHAEAIDDRDQQASHEPAPAEFDMQPQLAAAVAGARVPEPGEPASGQSRRIGELTRTR
ncbi:MAG: arginine deiminase family protein [Streptosporangiaceae bacterium]